MTISAEIIIKAACALKEGELVAFPTETVYGLGGNALSDNAVAAIFEAKGRPRFNPLIVHVASLDDAKKIANFSEQAKKLAKDFWPGPLTLVLPRAKDCRVSLLVSAGLDSIAIRIPAHPTAQALLAAAGIPIAAPSANRSGHVSPTTAAHVREELGDRVEMILDGGACAIGIESTVVDMTEEVPIILRPGFVTKEELESIVKLDPGFRRDDKIKSPGMLERHYAPSKSLRLGATEIKPGEGLLAFGAPLPNASIIENLSANKNLREAAANLFAMLRKLDASAAKTLAVMPIPEEGLGVAINDRLRRAAQ